ncbi:MAG: peptidylprolyl isomerase [Elusimicrobiaceae bacterium]|jgi:peptidyl-prolyl cis-trans isomerase A (cyclophilin A)
MNKVLALSACTMLFAACGPEKSVTAPAEQPMTQSTQTAVAVEKPIAELGLQPGEYAVFSTEKGRIVAKLYTDKAPQTVANFVGLAKGEKEWTDPVTRTKKKAPFYDGLTFMRVIPGFMIQGGDPLNTCQGGPGYTFKDEFNPALTFSKPGLLAMANAGPNTNGSQFFITDVPGAAGYPTHLNNKHTIFGEVVDGITVVSAIAQEPANGGMAIKPVVMKKVEIIEIK